MKSFKTKAFTLVELIVVVAIATILLSLLQPSLAKTISIAEDKECKNNLGEIARSVLFYIDDNAGTLPGPFWSGIKPRFGRYNNSWNYQMGSLLLPYMHEEKDEDDYRYISTFICPTVKEQELEQVDKLIDRISYHSATWRGSIQDRPFGRPAYKTLEEIAPLTIDAIPNTSEFHIMEDADRQNMTWVPQGYLTEYPTHFQTYRNRNYFDGHVDKEDWYP